MRFAAKIASGHNMIITYLSGRLGNQLFQYAAGLSAARRLKVPLGMDLRWYQGRSETFDLGQYQTEYQILTNDQLPPDPKRQKLRYICWRTLGYPPKMLRERRERYDKRFDTIRDGTYLKGYWQCEGYFKAIADVIRNEFQPREPAEGMNAHLLQEIHAQPGAVALHIRRGDYVSDARTAARHGGCSLQYYQHGVEYIAERIDIRPVVYAFSDDPDWVESHLKLPCEMKVMRHNDEHHAHEDMRLMSACRHHVIANSSFSWWGAWLNPRPDKIVIAPQRWFADPKLHNPDIVPRSWVKLENE